ncbi:MAG: hemerythrin domain-containing protein [Bdellovibrionia bacterium]
MERTHNRSIQDEIKSDHKRIKQLFDQWDAADEGSSSGQQIINDALSELEIHSQIEEEVLYPECRRVGMTNPSIIDDAVDDHVKIDDMIQDMRNEIGGRKEDDFRVLMRDVLTHIDEEEASILPQLENLISVEESEKIGERLRARKLELRSASTGRAA